MSFTEPMYQPFLVFRPRLVVLNLIGLKLLIVAYRDITADH